MFFKKTNSEVGMHTTPTIFALQIYRRYSKNNMVVCYFQFSHVLLFSNESIWKSCVFANFIKSIQNHGK